MAQEEKELFIDGLLELEGSLRYFIQDTFNPSSVSGPGNSIIDFMETTWEKAEAHIIEIGYRAPTLDEVQGKIREARQKELEDVVINLFPV